MAAYGKLITLKFACEASECLRRRVRNFWASTLVLCSNHFNRTKELEVQDRLKTNGTLERFAAGHNLPTWAQSPVVTFGGRMNKDLQTLYIEGSHSSTQVSWLI
jgi:hypothetical protein